MKRLALALLAVAGCSNLHDDNPVLPGGPNTGNSAPEIDAPGFGDADGDGGGPLLTARVCLVTDLRRPNADCEDDLAGGIVVQLGTRLAQTARDGSFVIEVSAGSNLVWRVSGAANNNTDPIVTSLMPFTLDLRIPAITVDDYDDLLSTNGAILADQQGSLLIRLVSGLNPVQNAQVTVDPDAQFVFYDDAASAERWGLNMTQGDGAAWITAAPLGDTRIGVAGELASSLFPVENQAITFGVIDIF